MGRPRAPPYVPPIVGSLFSWKSLLTKRITSDDFPTAASPSSTSLTLLLGLGWASDMVVLWLDLRVVGRCFRDRSGAKKSDERPAREC
jgi:hypothetical protein